MIPEINTLNRWLCRFITLCLLSTASLHAEDIFLKRYVEIVDDPNSEDPEVMIEQLVAEDTAIFITLVDDSEFSTETISATQAQDAGFLIFGSALSLSGVTYYVFGDTVVDPSGIAQEYTYVIRFSSMDPPDLPPLTIENTGDPDGDGTPGPVLPAHPEAAPNDDESWEWQMGDPQVPGLTNGGTHENPADDQGENCQAPPRPGMVFHRVNSRLASLRLQDVPLSYRAPFGPQPIIRLTYNDDGSMQERARGSWLGPRWSFNWLQFLVPVPVSLLPNTQTPTPFGVELKVVGGSGGAARVLQYVSPGGVTANPMQSPVSHAKTEFEQGTLLEIKRKLPDETVETYVPSATPVQGNPLTDPPNVWLKSMVWVLKKVTDKYGHTTTLTWDGLRLKKITDAANKETLIHYLTENPLSHNRWRISRITDPHGRVALFHYNHLGHLVSITDAIGVKSQFLSQANDGVVTSLITPLQKTDFARIDAGPWKQLEISDSQGNKERIRLERAQDELTLDKTFWWNKQAMKQAGPGGASPAPNLATIYEWTEDAGAIVSSVTPPSRGKVTMAYLGSFVGSITTLLDDGTAQHQQFLEWNGDAHAPRTIIDPQGRVTTFTFHQPGNKDVHTVTLTVAGQAPRTLATYENYENGRPKTIIDENNATTQLLYNAKSQVTKITTPDGRVIDFGYNGYQQLQTVTRKAAVQAGVTTPADIVTTYGYDSLARLATVVTTGGNSVTYAYDAVRRLDLEDPAHPEQEVYGSLDRLVKATYPGGTHERVEFDRLWLSASYDRLGRKTTYTHDVLGQIDSVTDPAGRTIHFTNSACCGSGVDQLTDGNGKVTRWEKNVAGQVIKKTIDWKTVAEYGYGPNTGWLAWETDAKGNKKTYGYTAEGQLSSVAYTIVANTQTAATGSVGFTYDAFGRQETMTDPTGLTTWEYLPSGGGVGQLKEVNKKLAVGGALFERLQYAYDTLGRLSERRVGIDQAMESYSYDGFGRLKELRNPLGAPVGGGAVTPFTWTYGGPGGALSETQAPNGIRTLLDYYTGPTEDRRLKSIVHKRPGDPGEIFSSHFYEWDAVGRLKKWDQFQLPTGGSLQKRTGIYGYNQADELTDAAIKNLAGVETGRWKWDYDAAGNRIHEQEGTAVATWVANEFNQLLTRAGGGQVELRGEVDRPASVTVNGQTVPVNGFGWSKMVTAQVGENSYTVTASEIPPPPEEVNPNWFLDPNDPDYVVPPPWHLPTDHPDYQQPPPPPPPPQTARGKVNYTVAATPPKVLTYDANGNLTNDGERTYEWDAENRLVLITGSWGRTVFEYDGMSRRVKLIEQNTAGTQNLAERRFGWEGLSIAEERNASNDVVKRYWGLGEERPGTTPIKLTYTRDHLGSVREVLDQTGAIRARYAYGEWGNRTKVEGDLECDLGFTGHFEHMVSGTTFAPYRGYRSDLGRWLNKDPIEEEGGLNLYGYVTNQPTLLLDPLGLESWGDMRALPGYTGPTTLQPSDEETQREIGGMIGKGILDYAQKCLNNTLEDMKDPMFWLGMGKGGKGSIYKVPGSATKSGRPYIGRHKHPNPAKTRRSSDGRDRTKAKVIDNYNPNDPMSGRVKEQGQIEANGGVKNLDNKRNEIRPKP